jgi:hypothetical protein
MGRLVGNHAVPKAANGVSGFEKGLALWITNRKVNLVDGMSIEGQRCLYRSSLCVLAVWQTLAQLPT